MNAQTQTPASPGKPFDLQKAIAGEPLITRDGRKARYGTTIQN